MRIIAAFKAFVLSAVLLAVLSVAASAHPAHPRIIYDEQDFETLAKVLESGDNQVINRLHECIMMAADAAVADESVLKYEKDASNRRILHVSRSAMKRLIPCSYAYRMTGNKKYLRKVRYDLQAVCAFPDWNHSHFLDVAEMATGVSIAYDWLYDSLGKKLREKVLKTICDYAIEPSFLMENDKPWWFFTTANNWNQVCNGGLVVLGLLYGEINIGITVKIVLVEVIANYLTEAVKGGIAACRLVIVVADNEIICQEGLTCLVALCIVKRVPTLTLEGVQVTCLVNTVIVGFSVINDVIFDVTVTVNSRYIVYHSDRYVIIIGVIVVIHG